MAETIANKTNWTPEMMDQEYTITEGDFSVAIIGDMHLHATTFRSRVDDYPETSIQKLGVLRRELLAKDIKYVIILGDIFHIPKERTDYEYRVIAEFLKFKDAGIQVFAISGNHDVSFERLENIEKSSLGILFLTGTIKPFTKITFDRGDKTNIVFTGFNFPNEPCPPDDKSSFNICVAHKFFENGFDKEGSVTSQDVELLGYNMFCLGHDHQPFDLTKVPTPYGVVGVVRPGSFMRATSHNYNTNRMVYMDEIKITSRVDVVRHTLPVRPPEEVFPSSVINKDELINLSKVTKELADLVTQIYSDSSSSGDSVYDILDSSPIEDSIKNRIVTYLELNGIYRKQSSLSNLEEV